MSEYEHRGHDAHDSMDVSDVWQSGGGCALRRAIPMVDAQLDSKDLFAAGRLITIAHGEHTYQLRLTAQNKLILTK